MVVDGVGHVYVVLCVEAAIARGGVSVARGVGGWRRAKYTPRSMLRPKMCYLG